MKKWKVWHGLAGGFGGADCYDEIEANTEEEAIDMAYELACEDYMSYEGLHGLRSWQEIFDDFNNDEYADEPLDDMDEDDCKVVDSAYNEERESWLDYRVEEITE